MGGVGEVPYARYGIRKPPVNATNDILKSVVCKPLLTHHQRGCRAATVRTPTPHVRENRHLKTGPENPGECSFYQTLKAEGVGMSETPNVRLTKHSQK